MNEKKPLPKKLEEDLQQNHYRLQRPSLDDKPPIIKKVFDDSVEKAMYDEIFGSIHKPKSSKLPAGSGYEASKGSSKAAPNQDNDFISTLVQRLNLIETEAKDLRSKLSEQLVLNQKLQEENQLLTASVNNPNHLNKEIQRLSCENKHLQDQIQEMEVFLADYGLIWVGYKGDPNILPENDEEEVSTSHMIPYDEFVKLIQELNTIIFSEPTKVIIDESHRKAKLGHASELTETIKISYYKNGLLIKRGPFRPCGSLSYHQFMKDIVDGFFPSEYKDEYPDGVLFDIVDKQDVEFSIEQNDIEKLSKDQFLHKLPKTVVKNGNIVEIRSSVDEIISSTDPSTSTTNSNNNQHKKSSVITLNSLSLDSLDVDRSKITKIQIKGFDENIYLGTFLDYNTIGDLKASLRKHFQDNDLKVEIRSAFPPRVLDDSTTFLEASLVPNATVHAKRL